MKHIPIDSVYKAQHGWLQSHFHFSFAQYQDKENMHFGALRVMNDDLVQAHSGFNEHPHHDMEIITYVIRGELTHKDSMGNKESLGRGAIQYLSAGTGITHSEDNEGDEEVHLIQTWILPSEKGLNPQYGSKIFEEQEHHNKWLHLIAPEGTKNVINIYQDANMYVTELDSGKVLDFVVSPHRQVYIKVMEGSANINTVKYKQGDAGEIVEEDITVQALSDVHILLVEMKAESSLV